MDIVLNNNQEHFDNADMTISELLAARNFTFKMLVIKVNGRLIKKTEYDSARVHDGDEVQVLHLISGG
jgi:thiamine biosynthesis protein ThiS